MKSDEWPIAKLSLIDQELLGSKTAIILLSRETLNIHLEKHPEITEADYNALQTILDTGEVWRVPERPERLVYITVEGIKYLAAIKRTQDGRKNYLLTLFRNQAQKVPKAAVRVR